MHNCNICSSQHLESILFMERFPYFTIPVTSQVGEKILKKYSHDQLTTNLQINACLECGHCHQDTLPDFKVLNDLYANHYQYPSPLEANFNPERDNTFINIFNDFFQKNDDYKKTDKKILEIGCFDGYVLYHLKKFGFNVIGCDPSEGAIIGKKYGVPIYQEFFEPERFQARKEMFDIVISRHFVEHVVHPLEYINSFKQVLHSDGLLVIEVPNATYYLKKGLMEVFSPQHIQGFSVKSLTLLLKKASFDNIYTIESENNLIAFARNNISKNENETLINYQEIIIKYLAKLNDNRKMIKNIIQKYVKKNKKIALWGAGGFAIAAFKFYDISPFDITCIIDSDPKKVGLKFLGIDLEIALPTKEIITQLDLIVVTSMYTKSIIEMINKIDSKISILAIYPKPQLIS